AGGDALEDEIVDACRARALKVLAVEHHIRPRIINPALDVRIERADAAYQQFGQGDGLVRGGLPRFSLRGFGAGFRYRRRHADGAFADLLKAQAACIQDAWPSASSAV